MSESRKFFKVVLVYYFIMVETKKKNWFRRHWILTIILGIVVLGIIAGMFGGDSQSNSSSTENNQQEETSNTQDVWSKSSGYTVDECEQVCEEAYDLQAQVSVCQGNCIGIYGKPSDSLDKYVNTVKDIKNRE